MNWVGSEVGGRRYRGLVCIFGRVCRLREPSGHRAERRAFGGPPEVSAVMRIGRVSRLVVFACLLSCAKDPVRPPVGPPPDPFSKPTVDFSPAWSLDGRFICYRRAYPSTDGLPGVYVISRWGGKPRFITGANFFWPADLRFSPDGRFLAAAIDLQLAIIDLSSGVVSIPIYTDNWARFPDWSPDGRFIVYSRLVVAFGEPPDSAGLHIYEPATGRDWPIAHVGQVVLGREPRWSPDGRWIAFITTSPVSVMIVRPDGSELRTLLESNGLLEDLRWYQRGLTGANGVICTDHGRGTYFIDVATGLTVPTRHFLTSADEFSPDGSEFVTLLPQPTDSLGVVFTQSVDDFSGATRFQVTRYLYAPPGSTSSSQRAEPIVQFRKEIP